MTATTDVVISEKSKLELLMSDLNGTAHSRMSTIRMGFILIPVKVRSASPRPPPAHPCGAGADGRKATEVRRQFARPSQGSSVSRFTGGGDHGRQRPFRGSP